MMCDDGRDVMCDDAHVCTYKDEPGTRMGGARHHGWVEPGTMDGWSQASTYLGFSHNGALPAFHNAFFVG